METEELLVGKSIDSQNDHNGQELPEGLEDVEGLGDPEDEPEFPSNLDPEVLKMCKRYNTVFCEHLKRGRYIKGAPMRYNLVPEENRVKPLYQAVPRVVPLHWREEAEKIVKIWQNTILLNVLTTQLSGAFQHSLWPSQVEAEAFAWWQISIIWTETFLVLTTSSRLSMTSRRGSTMTPRISSNLI